MEKDIIGPGDSAALEIRFSTQSYRGPIMKRPYIVANTLQQNHRVTIITNITPADKPFGSIEPTPRSLVLGGYPTWVYATDLVLTNQTEQILDLDVIDCPSTVLSIDIPASLAPGQSDSVRVATLQPEPGIKIVKSITIQCSDSSQSRISIPIEIGAGLLTDEAGTILGDCP